VLLLWLNSWSSVEGTQQDFQLIMQMVVSWEHISFQEFVSQNET
jgi:hypothetical protein